MQDKALQSEKMQDNPAKSRTVGNSGEDGSYRTAQVSHGDG